MERLVKREIPITDVELRTCVMLSVQYEPNMSENTLLNN